MPIDVSNLRSFGLGRSGIRRSSSSSSSSGGVIGARRSLSAVMVVPLLERKTLTASVVSDTVYEEVVITDEDMEDMAPHIQDIVPHPETRALSGQFEWRVLIQRKYLDADWVPTTGITANDLIVPLQTVNGYSPGTAYTDRTRLGIKFRLVLQWHTRATGGGVIGDKAEVSLALALRKWTA